MFKILSKQELEKMEFKELMKYHSHLQLAKEKGLGEGIIQDIQDFIMDEIEQRFENAKKISYKGYFTSKENKEFCGRYFEANKKYHIVKETGSYVLVKADGDKEEQMMTKEWIKKGMFKFLTFHEEK
jgi:isocitrate dehydrogenase